MGWQTRIRGMRHFPSMHVLSLRYALLVKVDRRLDRSFQTVSFGVRIMALFLLHTKTLLINKLSSAMYNRRQRPLTVP